MKENSLNVKEKKLSKVAFSHVGCEKNLVDTEHMQGLLDKEGYDCLLYTSPSPRDQLTSRMPSSA